MVGKVFQTIQWVAGIRNMLKLAHPNLQGQSTSDTNLFDDLVKIVSNMDLNEYNPTKLELYTIICCIYYAPEAQRHYRHQTQACMANISKGEPPVLIFEQNQHHLV